MRSVFQLIIASLFFVSLAHAQEKLLPLKSHSSTKQSSVQEKWKSIDPKPLPAIKTAKFISFDSNDDDILEFAVQTDQGLRSVSLGKTAHNLLLKNALLNKIGYTAPATAFLPKLEINFADRTEKRLFISKLEQRTGADTDRWVTEENKTSLTLQDAIISEAPDQIDQAAFIIPATLTHVPESINLFSWVSGTVYSDGVKVDYPHADRFEPTLEEIQQILSRIATLTREDWAAIAKSASLPDAVEVLLVEKLIARRNSFLQLFSVEESILPFDPKVTVKPDLINGQVTKKEWPGYASLFSFGTPDSPLNPGEMFAFTKSRLFSSILSAAVSKVNDLSIFHTDAAGTLEKHLTEMAAKGKNSKQSIGAWSFPFASGELIFSRDIVTGTFMGTDSLLQLADQFGIRLSLGAQISVDGLPTVVGAGLRGAVSISRTYSHLKPIKSIKKANHYGYQNAVVPFFINRSVKKLNPLFDDDFQTLPAEQKQKVYLEALADFKHKIAPGESIIITDSLIGDGRATGSVSLYQLIDLSAAAQTDELVIRRLHIYRKDENTFQIYKDFGEATQPSFGIELGVKRPIIPTGSFLPSTFDKDAVNTSTMPIIRAKFGNNQGHTSTQFFTLNFEDGRDQNSDLDESAAQLKILHDTLLYTTTEALRKHVKPYKIENHFWERNSQDRMLFFSQRRLKSVADLTITDPDGEKHSFLRNYYGKSNAFDYKNTMANILDFTNQMLTHSVVDFDADTSINPGYTSNGRAKNQLLSFEAEVLDDGSLKDPFVKLSHSHNGWKVSKNKIQKILDQFNRDYGSNIFAPTSLNETEKMFLYNVSLDIYLYENALNHLMELTEKDIRDLFAKYHINLDHRLVDDRIVNRLKEFKRSHSSKSLMKAIAIADHFLPADGFVELFGGKENIFITARIDGFRQGDENGNTPIISNTVGVAGSSQTMGPLTTMRKKLGMTEGEFLSLWILGRIL